MKDLNLKKVLGILGVTALFVALTIVLIIIAQGKKFDDGGKFVDTSIIHLNVKPNDVKAYINGEEVRINETRIEGITPGEVILRLTKEGYAPWERTILLRGSEVKDVSAQLFPVNLKSEQITSSNVDKVFFSQNGDYIFYSILSSDIESEIGIWKLRIIRNIFDFGNIRAEKLPIDNEILTLMKTNDYDISIAQDSSKILISGVNKNFYKLVDTSNPANNIDLKTELGYLPDNAQWFNNSSSLIIEKGSVIYEYNIASKAKVLINLNENNVNNIYSISESVLYYYRSDNKSIYAYSNGISNISVVNTLLAEPKVISSIAFARSNKNRGLLKIEDKIIFIDIEKRVIKEVTTGGDIEEVSSNGRSAILRKADGFYAFTTEETLSAEKYDLKVNRIVFDTNEISDAYYANNGLNILVISKVLELNKVLLTDNAGLNLKDISTDLSVVSQMSQISGDGKTLYLLIKDSNTGTETTLEKKNIYKISLEIQ